MASAWRPVSHGSMARHWFVCRDKERHGGPIDVATDSRGNYRRFASYEAAKCAADALNG